VLIHNNSSNTSNNSHRLSVVGWFRPSIPLTQLAQEERGERGSGGEMKGEPRKTQETKQLCSEHEAQPRVGGRERMMEIEQKH
jgi:hypothetical protein